MQKHDIGNRHECRVEDIVGSDLGNCKTGTAFVILGKVMPATIMGPFICDQNGGGVSWIYMFR
jgi:hypothetical protein